jgi:hypothetical protein
VRHAGPGRIKDAGGAAKRGAGEPILSSADVKAARASALSALGKIGGTAHPWAGPARHRKIKVLKETEAWKPADLSRSSDRSLLRVEGRPCRSPTVAAISPPDSGPR